LYLLLSRSAAFVITTCCCGHLGAWFNECSRYAEDASYWCIKHRLNSWGHGPDLCNIKEN